MSNTDLLEQLELAARAAADSALAATVSIGRDGRGAGVVVAEGKVLTNAHNLQDRTTQVTFADGHTAQASLAGADVEGDLVVVDVDTGDIVPLAWSEREPTVGNVVFAGSRGRGGGRLSFGIVSATGRSFRGPRGRVIHGSIEHTAPLARGSSGGPLVDRDGKLLGINTSRLGEGFYLAISADGSLRTRVEGLSAGRSTSRPVLGVALAPAHVARRLRASVGLEPLEGLLVRGVEQGSAADRAGIRQGDLLVAAAGSPLVAADDLFVVLDSHDVAVGLELSLVRGAEELSLQIDFGDVADEGDDE